MQAEFAQNVVQYLHRIGRASRAGRQGIATNFYDDSSHELVESILAAQETAPIPAPAVTITDVEVKAGSEEADEDPRVGGAVHHELEVGRIDKSFSRRRGFRKRIRKLTRGERESTQGDAGGEAGANGYADGEVDAALGELYSNSEKEPDTK